MAEWEEQAGVILAFPHVATDWADYLEEARTCVVEIVNAIRRFESVYLLTDDVASTTAYFPDTVNLHLVPMAYNDTWMRDCIALSVFDQAGLMFVDFTFTGWGDKFEATLDNQISSRLHEAGILERMESVDLILEGGGVESDGNGTILTTELCLLNANRNHALDRLQIEARLLDSLGAKRLLWLEDGHLEGDDTDGHIDTLARFCDERTIAYVGKPHSSDPHYEAMAQMERQLTMLQDANKDPYRLVPLPFVPEQYYEGERLPATYANFLIINKAVLVPTYNASTDTEALRILETVFPDREIIGIDCSVLIRQHGSLHCMTMQIAKPLKEQ